MFINQEIELDITPKQIARYIYETWTGEDLVEFMNECGVYLSDWEDIIESSKDYNTCQSGKSFLKLLEKCMQSD